MFALLKKEYSKSTVQLCNKLLDAQAKIKKKILLVKFLKECIIKNVSPKWIMSRICKSKLKLSTKIEHLFLNSEISKYEISIGNLKHTFENCLLSLKNKVSDDHLKNFVTYMDQVINSKKKNF